MPTSFFLLEACEDTAASQELPQGDDERDDDRDEDDVDEDEAYEDEDEEDNCTASGWTGVAGAGGGCGCDWATFELLAAPMRPRCRGDVGGDGTSNRSPLGEKYNAESWKRAGSRIGRRLRVL